MKSLHRKLHPAAFLFILIPFLATLALVFSSLQPNSTTEYRSQAAPVCRVHGEYCNESIYPCCAGLACSNSVCVGPTATPKPTCTSGWQCGTQCASSSEVSLFKSTWCDGKSRWLYESGRNQGINCGGSASSVATNGCNGGCASGSQCMLKSTSACSNPANVVGSCITTNGVQGSCCKIMPTSSPRPTATRTPTPTMAAPRSYLGQKCDKEGYLSCDNATGYSYYCSSNLTLVRGNDLLCVKPSQQTGCSTYLPYGAECTISKQCNSCTRCSGPFKLDPKSSTKWRCISP